MTIDSDFHTHVNNIATEQCMHALDHLALSRIGQFCQKRFELSVFPAKVQTIHITSTIQNNVSKIKCV